MFKRKKNKKDGNRSGELVVKNHPKSVISEAYRLLRTNINFLSPDKDLKTVLITSGNPDEGKSIIAANLAISLAQGGKEVLIVDADLRRSTLHRVFETTNYEGLTNVLTGEGKLKYMIKDTEVENLQILNSGPLPPNPAELVGSQRMKQFLSEVQEEYDIIIIDTPPVIAVADGLILGTAVDGVMLVVRYKETPRDAVKQACENLKKVNAPLLGTVFTKYPLKSGYGYYYYY